MTGSSDGLIRFWENEGDASWIVKITLFVLLHLFFVAYLGKNSFWLICTQGKHTVYQ